MAEKRNAEKGCRRGTLNSLLGSRIRTMLGGVHGDDPALSIHKAKRFLPSPQALVTIFSKSTHTGPAYAVRIGEDVEATRAGEDRRYAAAEGAAYWGLGFLDDPVAAEGDGGFRAELIRGISRRISQLIGKLDPDILAVALPYPNAPRRHVHHGVAFQAALEATHEQSRPTLVLCDDLVYGRAPVDAVVRCRGIDYLPFVVPLSPEDVSQKLRAVGSYESQTPSRYTDAVLLPAPGDLSGRPSEVLRVPRHLRITALDEFAAARSDSPVYELPEPFPSAENAFVGTREARACPRSLPEVGVL